MSASSGGGGGGFSPPWWFSRAAALFTGGSATVAGIAIWDNPVEFAIASVASWIVDGILDLFVSGGELILVVATQILGAFGDAGVAIASGIATAAGIPIQLIRLTNEIIVTAASALGPLAFGGVVVGWAIVGGTIAITIRAIVEVIRFI